MSFIKEAKDLFFNTQDQYLYSFFYYLKHPAWNNPFYIILSVASCCVILELILPKKENYPVIGRKGFFLDILYFFFVDFVFWAIGFYAFTSVFEFGFLSLLSALGIDKPQLFNISSLPVALQFLILFIIVDFAEYVGHFLLHRIDFLWAFHKIHHAQEELGAFSTRHFHWFEYFIFKPLLYIPLSLIGFSVENYIIFQLWIGFFLTFLSHSNIKVKWGILNHIIITPDTHYWHHARNIPRKYGVNYASNLNIWDRVFGTFYFPTDQKPVLGIPDMNTFPKTFWGQMLYPFRNLKGENNQNREVKPEPYSAKKKKKNRQGRT